MIPEKSLFAPHLSIKFFMYSSGLVGSVKNKLSKQQELLWLQSASHLHLFSFEFWYKQEYINRKYFVAHVSLPAVMLVLKIWHLMWPGIMISADSWYLNSSTSNLPNSIFISWLCHSSSFLPRLIFLAIFGTSFSASDIPAFVSLKSHSKKVTNMNIFTGKRCVLRCRQI